jgi:hypothetical protein
LSVECPDLHSTIVILKLQVCWKLKIRNKNYSQGINIKENLWEKAHTFIFKERISDEIWTGEMRSFFGRFFL